MTSTGSLCLILENWFFSSLIYCMRDLSYALTNGQQEGIHIRPGTLQLQSTMCKY